MRTFTSKSIDFDGEILINVDAVASLSPYDPGHPDYPKHYTVNLIGGNQIAIPFEDGLELIDKITNRPTSPQR